MTDNSNQRDEIKPPASGWLWLDNRVTERIAEIGTTALAVYVVLARFADRDRCCYPAIDTVARMIGASSRRTVHAALKRLVSAGLIRSERAVDHLGRSRPSIYRLLTLPPDGEGAASCTPGCSQLHGEGAIQRALGVQPVAPEQDREQDLLKKTKRAPADAGAPAGLLELVDGWNDLGSKIVRDGNGARRDPPAKATLTGWARAQRDPELHDALADVPALLAAIRKAKFCHGQGWFTLAWIFGRNRNGELNAAKLLNGAHDDGQRTNGQAGAAIGPGQRHDPDAPVKWE